MELDLGQTYICTNDNHGWWTIGKEYQVYFDLITLEYGLKDDNGVLWYGCQLDEIDVEFELKKENKND